MVYTCGCISNPAQEHVNPAQIPHVTAGDKLRPHALPQPTKNRPQKHIRIHPPTPSLHPSKGAFNSEHSTNNTEKQQPADNNQLTATSNKLTTTNQRQPINSKEPKINQPTNHTTTTNPKQLLRSNQQPKINPHQATKHAAYSRV